jgi:hypothetical protein
MEGASGHRIFVLSTGSSYGRRRIVATREGAAAFVGGRFREARNAPAATGVVAQPSAREGFTARELVAACGDFLEDEARYRDAETGLKAAAYRFRARVLFVYEEPETGVVVLLRPPS